MSLSQPVRVVIADDAEQLRALLSRALERDGLIEVVGQAGDGVSAVEAVSASDPDVLLLDLSMPMLDGLEVIRCVRESGSRAAIVVFSGYGTDHLAETCLRLGAFDYIEKGAPLSEVRSRILAAAGQRGDSP